MSLLEHLRTRPYTRIPMIASRDSNRAYLESCIHTRGCERSSRKDQRIDQDCIATSDQIDGALRPT